MLTVDPAKRATLEDVKKDKWFNMDYDKSNETNSEINNQPLTLSPEEQLKVFDEMEKIGIDRETVKKCLNENAYDNISATYYLIADRHLRKLASNNNEKSVSDEIIDNNANKSHFNDNNALPSIPQEHASNFETSHKPITEDKLSPLPDVMPSVPTNNAVTSSLPKPMPSASTTTTPAATPAPSQAPAAAPAPTSAPAASSRRKRAATISSAATAPPMDVTNLRKMIGQNNVEQKMANASNTGAVVSPTVVASNATPATADGHKADSGTEAMPSLSSASPTTAAAAPAAKPSIFSRRRRERAQTIDTTTMMMQAQQAVQEVTEGNGGDSLDSPGADDGSGLSRESPPLPSVTS